MPETLEEQLTKHLTDVHSIEVQALLQMRVAPRMARDPQLARAFREHIVETEEQERLVRERLAARGADPSRLKDIAGRAGGVRRRHRRGSARGMVRGQSRAAGALGVQCVGTRACADTRHCHSPQGRSVDWRRAL